MGIIIDIVLLVILVLSAFAGYKKGLVELGTKLFAGIIAIIVTIIIYKPVANIIINNTSIDEKIENTIIQNTTNFINENFTAPIDATNEIADGVITGEASNIAKSVVYAITAIILFIIVKIALSIVISFMDFVANLPILKQFNEIGGLLYGIIRGLIIIFICVLIMGVFTKINPESSLKDEIESSILTDIIYKNISKF